MMCLRKLREKIFKRKEYDGDNFISINGEDRSENNFETT